jgi:hypothetical protein
MVPGILMRLESMPLTPNGKLDRDALPAPEAARLERGTPLSSPTDEIERALAELWKELLQVENVGIHDGFFDLGAHSLLLVQAHGRIVHMFQTNLSVVQMFEYPTVAALARYIREGHVHTAAESGATKSVREGRLRIRQRFERRTRQASIDGGGE